MAVVDGLEAVRLARILTGVGDEEDVDAYIAGGPEGMRQEHQHGEPRPVLDVHGDPCYGDAPEADLQGSDDGHHGRRFGLHGVGFKARNP